MVRIRATNTCTSKPLRAEAKEARWAPPASEDITTPRLGLSRKSERFGTISTDAKLSNTTKTLRSCCNAVLTLMKSRTWPDKNGGLQYRPAHSIESAHYSTY